MHQSDVFFYLTFDQWQHLHASSEVRTNYAAIIRRKAWQKLSKLPQKVRLWKNLD